MAEASVRSFLLLRYNMRLAGREGHDVIARHSRREGLADGHVSSRHAFGSAAPTLKRADASEGTLRGSIPAWAIEGGCREDSPAGACAGLNLPRWISSEVSADPVVHSSGGGGVDIWA